jgi:hypothetical protein
MGRQGEPRRRLPIIEVRVWGLLVCGGDRRGGQWVGGAGGCER